MRMIRPVLLAMLLSLPASALAQAQQQPPAASPAAQGPAVDSAESARQPPQRIRNVQLQRGQQCPRSTSAEVVVCSTIEEPYRIPKQFRDEGPVPAQNQSWVNRTASAAQASRTAAGLPDTCSPIGYGGQSGCALMWNQQWRAEKRAQERAAESVPGGE